MTNDTAHMNLVNREILFYFDHFRIIVCLRVKIHFFPHKKMRIKNWGNYRIVNLYFRVNEQEIVSCQIFSQVDEINTTNKVVCGVINLNSCITCWHRYTQDTHLTHTLTLLPWEVRAGRDQSSGINTSNKWSKHRTQWRCRDHRVLSPLAPDSASTPPAAVWGPVLEEHWSLPSLDTRPSLSPGGGGDLWSRLLGTLTSPVEPGTPPGGHSSYLPGLL